MANRGTAPTDAAIAAAAGAVGTGPVAFLVGARLANDPAARATLEKLAEALGASAESGMVGSPAIAANGRGAADLAADIVAADREAGSAAAKAQAGDLKAVLLLGNEAWPSTGAARKVVVTSGALVTDDTLVADDTVDVVLPMAHPYEQLGSLTTWKAGCRACWPAGCRRKASRQTGCCWPG